MRTLDFGKHEGKILADCEMSYLKWLASHEQVLAKRNQWASRDAKFALLMLQREEESQKAQAALQEGKVFDKVLNEWVTPPSDDALDVEKHSKWGYAIERQAKNRDLAQKRNEITDISRRGNLYRNQGFQLMR